MERDKAEVEKERGVGDSPSLYLNQK